MPQYIPKISILGMNMLSRNEFEMALEVYLNKLEGSIKIISINRG